MVNTGGVVDLVVVREVAVVLGEVVVRGVTVVVTVSVSSFSPVLVVVVRAVVKVVETVDEVSRAEDVVLSAVVEAA